MSPQLLVNVLSITNLGAGASTTLNHGLCSNGAGVSPTLVFPDRTTLVVVTDVTNTTVTFRNTGAVPETVKFRCERGWQPEVDASTLTPMFWQGGTLGAALGDATAQSTPVQYTTGGLGGWTDYEEFEVAADGPRASLIGEYNVVLARTPISLPQQHLVVRNGRILRIQKDYLLMTNMIVLGRSLSDGDALVVYYNRSGV